MEKIKVQRSLQMIDFGNNCVLLFSKEGKFRGSLRIDDDGIITILENGPYSIDECSNYYMNEFEDLYKDSIIVLCSFEEMASIMQRLIANRFN